jgi:CRP-like cAMP-binding protein
MQMTLRTSRSEAAVDVNKSRNLLLRRLTPADRQRIGANVQEVPLAFKQTLFEQGKPVDSVYFPESGVVSVVTDLYGGESIETGTIGNEGLVGVPAVLGVGHSSSRVFCQIPGRAVRIPAAVIAVEREQGTGWFQLLLKYVNFVSAMAAQSAACNRMHAVDARMSRWLLMTHDRVDADDFPLTKEFLSHMLGVARPTVNIAGATLQKAGFINYRRGRITILDRAGLESASCECYRRIREELETSLNSHGARRASRAAKRRR